MKPILFRFFSSRDLFNNTHWAILKIIAHMHAPYTICDGEQNILRKILEKQIQRNFFAPFDSVEEFDTSVRSKIMRYLPCSSNAESVLLWYSSWNPSNLYLSFKFISMTPLNRKIPLNQSQKNCVLRISSVKLLPASVDFCFGGKGAGI